jgi:hypothetical protein
VLNASSGSKQGQTPERVPLKKAPAFGGGFLLSRCPTKNRPLGTGLVLWKR